MPSSNSDPKGGGSFIPPRQPGIAPSAFSPTPPPSSADEGSFLAYHARLIQVIQSAYTNPNVEDPAGRNAVHCLAEAMLHQPSTNSNRATPLSGSRPPSPSPSLAPPPRIPPRPQLQHPLANTNNPPQPLPSTLPPPPAHPRPLLLPPPLHPQTTPSSPASATSNPSSSPPPLSNPPAST